MISSQLVMICCLANDIDFSELSCPMGIAYRCVSYICRKLNNIILVLNCSLLLTIHNFGKVFVSIWFVGCCLVWEWMLIIREFSETVNDLSN